MNENFAYRDALDGIARRIDEWIEEGKQTIIALVIANGGFLKTPQCDEKPHLYAFYEDWDGRKSQVSIQGLHYNEELGLCLCTNDMLDNYQYDTDYEFEYYWSFDGEDLVQLNKALEDAAYYVEIDKYDCDITETILNLIHGLPAYL